MDLHYPDKHFEPVDFTELETANIRSSAGFEFDPIGNFIILNEEIPGVQITSDHRAIAVQYDIAPGALNINQRIRQHLLRKYEDLIEEKFPKVEPKGRRVRPKVLEAQLLAPT